MSFLRRTAAPVEETPAATTSAASKPRLRLGTLVHAFSPADAVCRAAHIVVIGQQPPNEPGPRVNLAVIGAPGGESIGNVRNDPAAEHLPLQQSVPPSDPRFMRHTSYHLADACPYGR